MTLLSLLGRGISMKRECDNFTEKDLLYWYLLTKKTIIEYQHPVTGLIPAHPGSDTWVRDCTYAIHSIWALSLAFEKQLSETNVSIWHELKFRVIKGMRGLLRCIMNQKEKVGQFNTTQSHLDCLHAKYDTSTGNPIVGDKDWGHLQLDATSLFVLTLAQITSSGYVIVQSLTEVDFVQSLVLYIHFAYRTPDFGVFERGDKNNRGIRELSACSVGMAKAALVAIRDLNLFGARGGASSVIRVPPDMSRQCNRVLESILPRGSKSKEIDSSTWSILTYPAFSVEKEGLLFKTKDLLKRSLEGNYGYKRFLLDGYRTPLEDKLRLHYNIGELRNFDGIECEWPLYFVYEWLDELFEKNIDSAYDVKAKLEKLSVPDKDGYPLIPELYFVPSDKVDEEKKIGSQIRLCGGKIPFIWAQSLFIVASLLHHEFVSTSDIDPLNRRLSRVKNAAPIVQILVLSENELCQRFADQHRIPCTPVRNNDITIITPKIVAKMWEELGLKWNGDQTHMYNSQRTSSLRTSIVYQYGDRYFVSLPEYSLLSSFYDNLDNEIFFQKTISKISYLSSQWRCPGRPMLPILLTPEMCAEESTFRFLDTLKSGSFQGVQVKLCDALTTLSTSFKQLVPAIPCLMPNANGVFSLESDEGKLNLKIRILHPTKDESHEEVLKSVNNICVLEIQLAETGLSMHEKCTILENFQSDNGYLPYSVIADVQGMYDRCCKERYWHFVRYCASLLKNVRTSICDDATHILVNQKHISFGAGKDEETISQPPSPTELLDIISRHSKNRIVLFALYQEILNYLCQMIQKNNFLFKGILRIRMNLLVKLIAKETSGDDDVFEKMCELKPIELFRIIHQLFSGGVSGNDGEQVTWERRRYIDGSLNRLPKNFHHNFYLLLNVTSGIGLEGNVLSSFPLINEMTAGEPQFAITISNWLDKVAHPQLRQLYVETIMILASLHKMIQSMPEIFELHAILQSAHEIFLSDSICWDSSRFLCGISQEFYQTPPTGQYGTLNYIAQAIAYLYK